MTPARPPIGLSVLLALVGASGLLAQDAPVKPDAPASPPATTEPAAPQPPLDSTISARCVGVAVVREVVDSDAQTYKPFGLDTGTRLSLVFQNHGMAIICFDAEASKLDSLTDDQGTNLLALAHRLQAPGFVPYGCGIAGDGLKAHVEVFGGTVPAAGATRVQAKGTAVFRVGSQKESAVSPLTRLKVGEGFLLGERFHFPISRLEKSGLGSHSAKMSLSYDGDCRQVAGVRFLDAKGQDLKARPAGWSRDENNGSPHSEFHFLFDPAPSECAIEVTFWSDMRAVTVPFAVEAGLGG